MARTIVVFAPTGLSSPSIDLVDSSDVVEENVSLTEDTNAKCRYTGTLTADAGTYTAVVKEGSDAIGAFGSQTVSGESDETLIVRDTVNAVITSYEFSGATITLISTVNADGTEVELRQGHDHLQTHGLAPVFTGTVEDQWPDLTGATVTFHAVQGSTTINKTMTVTAATGIQSFYVEFLDTELTTELAPTGSYRFYITAELADGSKILLVEDGWLRIKQPFSSGEYSS